MGGEEVGGGTRFTLDSLLFSLTSRPLEKWRGPPDSATPGGQWVTEQYGGGLFFFFFYCSHKTAWSHPSSAVPSWQRHSAANQSSYESSRVRALLIIIFPLGHKPICLIFNTTKFPLSRWQNGSQHCLKSCDENNFFQEPVGSWFRLERCSESNPSTPITLNG